MAGAERVAVRGAGRSGGGRGLPSRRDPELRGLLAGWYPAAFPPDDVAPVPLKRGIHRDLFRLPEPVPRAVNRMHQFLYGWVRRPAYLREMQAGRPRLDLQGHPTGQVEPAEADRAAAELLRRAASKAAKEALEAAARG